MNRRKLVGLFLLLLIMGVVWAVYYLTPRETLAPKTLSPQFSQLFIPEPAKATQRFRIDCRRQPNSQASRLTVPSERFENLEIDVCHLPAKAKSKRNLVVLVSGTHGAETLVGSAIQAYFLQHLFSELQNEQLGVLLIHGLNPFGFQTGRRVTENNVDLNRNFVFRQSAYASKNRGYQNLNALLNPATPAKTGWWSELVFLGNVARLLRKHSLEDLRQSVMQGQYEVPSGVFFGGKYPEPQVQLMRDLIVPLSEEYEKVLFIDIHTGYGERGKLHLYPNPIEDPKTKAMVEAVFSGFEVDYGDEEKMYSVTGSFSDYFRKLSPTPGKILPMVFEYGTRNSQTLLGSIRSLRTMIQENQGFHHGFVDERSSDQIQTEFREMFFPSSESWRAHVLEQTGAVLSSAIPRFLKMEK